MRFQNGSIIWGRVNIALVDILPVRFTKEGLFLWYERCHTLAVDAAQVLLSNHLPFLVLLNSTATSCARSRRRSD